MPQAPFNLVHLTDFHLFQARGASWRSFLNKRCLSYLSWRLHRGKINSPQMLSALLEFLPSLASDHVVVTGDLTHMGLPAECMRARRYLGRIGTPDQVFVIPGNHDAMVASAHKTWRDAWQAYLAADHHRQDSGRNSDAASYPAVRIRKGVALIGLSSARPTPPFSAAGRLGEDQRRRLAAILDQTGRQHLFRVLLIHHPIVRGQVRPRKSLRDAEALRTILHQYGAELVLHGHTHRHSHKDLPGPGAPIPVLGLPSSTADLANPDKKACVRVYTILPVKDGWRVEAHDHRLSSRGHGRPALVTTAWSFGYTRPNIAP